MNIIILYKVYISAGHPDQAGEGEDVAAAGAQRPRCQQRGAPQAEGRLCADLRC